MVRVVGRKNGTSDRAQCSISRLCSVALQPLSTLPAPVKTRASCKTFIRFWWRYWLWQNTLGFAFHRLWWLAISRPAIWSVIFTSCIFGQSLYAISSNACCSLLLFLNVWLYGPCVWIKADVCTYTRLFYTLQINPLDGRDVNTWPPRSNLHFNFWHSGTLALRAARQSARMSEILKCRLNLDGTEHFYL